MAKPSAPDRFIIRADVHIQGIEPRILRTIDLPLDLNFAQLHDVLQAAFGWTDSHLHQFNVGGLMIGAPEFDEEGWFENQIFEATEVHLRDLVFPYGGQNDTLRIVYEYDFGDNWQHELILRQLLPEDGITYPRCIAGARSGPPEDVGGTDGYADFLEAWHDPSHEEHKAMRRWAGRKFQPEAFDLEATNKAIAKVLRLARGSYRFRRLP